MALLFAAIFGALIVSACAEEGDTGALTNGAESAIKSGRKSKESDKATVPQITAKEHFLRNVHTSIATTCGACHTAGPGPAWTVPADGEKSYSLQFQRGYVSKMSAILAKGPHSGGPALTNEQASTYLTWVELEMKERGDKAPDSVLEKLGGCLDAAKFKAINLQNLVTTPRNADNNPQKETEDANACTGCNNAPCSTCHSSDPGSGFILALGNELFPEDHTLKETKSSSPPYIQKYFGLDPTGAPIPSKAIKAKSDATVKTGKAYSHPMYTLTPEMEKAIDAFVDDAIKKYKAGSCGPVE